MVILVNCYDAFTATLLFRTVERTNTDNDFDAFAHQEDYRLSKKSMENPGCSDFKEIDQNYHSCKV